MASNSPETVPPSQTSSPVNISKNDTPTQSFSTVLEPNYQSASIDIFNNGKNIDGEFETQQNYVTYKDEQYYLKGFHFHTNSEHTFNGQNTDGEIHLVHESSTGKRLVVGILLEGVDPNGPDANLIDPQLSSVFEKLDESLKDTNTIIKGVDFDPSTLISGDSQVYNYGGSLTTLPFTDAAWVVAADTLKVNANDLQNFSNLLQDFYGSPLNNRPIQNELFSGTDGDDVLQGDRNGPNGFNDDLIYARSGDDIVDGGKGNDRIFGGEGQDALSGGQGDDLLVGDADLAGVILDPSVKDDYLIGGEGKDQLYMLGNDFAVGGGPNSFNANFIELLNDEPFDLTEAQKAEFNLSDGQQDTFVFVNNGDGYTATIVGYESIDELNLSAFGVTSAGDFVESQEKDGGLWWEYTTDAEVVLRIDAAPDQLNFG